MCAVIGQAYFGHFWASGHSDQQGGPGLGWLATIVSLVVVFITRIILRCFSDLGLVVGLFFVVVFFSVGALCCKGFHC